MNCAAFEGNNAAVYRWCKRMVALNLDRRELEAAAGWAMLAGFHVSGHGFCGMIGDSELEDHLLTIGRTLPESPVHRDSCNRKRYLHVLTECYETGGHTRLCRRWVELSSERHRHSVVITSQVSALPEKFRRAIIACGGEFIAFNPQAPLLSRALALRRLACEKADVIVLHTHMEDPTPVMAFAVQSVPPVILLNHADHLFWFGGSVTDLVADFRQSGHERTKECRGIDKSFILPIPLEVSPPVVDEKLRLERRARERNRLGIPKDATVFLTVGSPYKYGAIGTYDFVSVALKLVERVPNSYLLAVGPSDGGEWREARLHSGDRILAMGTALELDPIHDSADIYLEGFPLGSGTALLEAGLAGLPCVRNPIISTALGRLDDPALDGVPSPANVDDIIAFGSALAASNETRKLESFRLRKAIVRHHCGQGWLRYLSDMEAQIPPRHRTQVRVPNPLPARESDFWMMVQHSAVIRSGYCAVRAIYDQARHRGLHLEGGLDTELKRDFLMVFDQHEHNPRASKKQLGEVFAADARFAYSRMDYHRSLTSFLSSLKFDPFACSNKLMACDMIGSLIGSIGLGLLRAGRNWVRRTFHLTETSKTKRTDPGIARR